MGLFDNDPVEQWFNDIFSGIDGHINNMFAAIERDCDKCLESLTQMYFKDVSEAVYEQWIVGIPEAFCKQYGELWSSIKGQVLSNEIGLINDYKEIVKKGWHVLKEKKKNIDKLKSERKGSEQERVKIINQIERDIKQIEVTISKQESKKTEGIKRYRRA